MSDLDLFLVRFRDWHNGSLTYVKGSVGAGYHSASMTRDTIYLSASIVWLAVLVAAFLLVFFGGEVSPSLLPLQPDTAL